MASLPFFALCDEENQQTQSNLDFSFIKLTNYTNALLESTIIAKKEESKNYFEEDKNALKVAKVTQISLTS